MSSAEVKGWTKLYEVTKTGMNNRRCRGQMFTATEIKDYSKSLQQLENQLQVFQSQQDQYQIDSAEIARRQILLDNLKYVMETATTTTTPIDALGGSGGLVSDEMLVQRQKEVMLVQDDMIGIIGKGVDRLHNKALQINEETKTHVRLLDSFDDDVEMATAALQAETKHAEKIRDQTRVCYLYICIAVEVLVLVLLIIIAFHS